MTTSRRTCNRLKRKLFIGLFLYTMGFGYIYTHLMQYIVIEENVINLKISGKQKHFNFNISHKSHTSVPFTTTQMKIQTTTLKPKQPKKKERKPVQMKEAPKPLQKPVNKPKNVFNPLKKSYQREFRYPLEIDFKKLIHTLESGNKTGLANPINPHDFHVLYSPDHSCKYNDDATHPKVVILVKSAVKNSERRTVIRNTWGSANISNVHIVFLLGLPTDGNLVVRKEHSMHGDIIQEDFIDDYRNNTVKMIMGFKWAVTHCDSTVYLFFVDDDYFVSIENLLKYLTSQTVKDTKELFSGTLLAHSTPFRANGSKWFMPWEDYPFDRWPPYLAGGGYFVSMAAARKFSLAFPYVKPIHIDDTYLGIVAKKLGIIPTSNRNIGYRKVQKASLSRYIACHGYGLKTDVEAEWLYQNKRKQPAKKEKVIPKH